MLMFFYKQIHRMKMSLQMYTEFIRKSERCQFEIIRHSK